MQGESLCDVVSNEFVEHDLLVDARKRASSGSPQETREGLSGTERSHRGISGSSVARVASGLRREDGHRFEQNTYLKSPNDGENSRHGPA